MDTAHNVPPEPRKASNVKLRSCILSCIFVTLICGPFFIYLAEKSDIVLPSWVTAEDANYLSGDASHADVKSSLSIEGFASGALQKEIEKSVGNRIPFKATAMLTNAELQRECIAASNLLFKWSCYPAFYGSSLSIDPSAQRLFDAPLKLNDVTLAPYREVATALEESAAHHNASQFYLYFAPDNQIVSDAPLGALVSDYASYEDILQVFLNADEKVRVIDGGVSYNSFQGMWYKTDHHWNIFGAYDAYKRIASAMGLTASTDEETTFFEYQSPKFYGSLARQALDGDFCDKLGDLIFRNNPPLTVTINSNKSGGEELLVHRDDYQAGDWSKQKFASRYGEYFHSDYGLIEIDNPGIASASASELLIVADSYSNCIERLFALDFSKIYVLDPRHTDEKLNSFLDEHPDVDKVLFLMRKNNLSSEQTLNFLS